MTFKRSKKRSQLAYEEMEARRVLASVFLDGAVLNIAGSSINDVVSVDIDDAGQIEVADNLNDIVTFSVGDVDSIRFFGGDGDDEFVATGVTDGIEAVDFFGGAGDDFFEFHLTSSGDTPITSLGMGHEGNDELLASEESGQQVEFYGGDGVDILGGGVGDDILVGGSGGDFINGGAGADTIRGNDGDDVINGDEGDDAIFGNDGNDEIDGGDSSSDPITGSVIAGGNDEIYGGSGDDTISGNDGDDILAGGEGADSIFGHAGVDQLFGGTQSDNLNGGDGDDFLYGGYGDDYLVGDAGADLLNGYFGDDTLVGDTVSDQIYAGEGTNTIVVASDESSDHDHADDSEHDHSSGEGVETSELEETPAVGIAVLNNFDSTLTVDIALANFEIVETESTDVVLGEGHLHVYVNGEKVDRIYGTTYTIEDVDPGEYTISVGLIAHDHSEYLLDGEAIVASSTIVVGDYSTVSLTSDSGVGVAEIVIGGGSAGDQAGESLENAGDVNGDGIDDLIIGAPTANNLDGVAYVVYGSADGFDETFSLADLDGTNGFALNGSLGEEAGQSVATAGDINNDGFADVIVGAPGSDVNGDNAGSAYVVYGGSNLAASIDLDSLASTEGIRIDGLAAGDLTGVSVGTAGDFNDDGFDDFLVGSTGTDNTAVDAGSAYLVYGAASLGSTFDLASIDGSNGVRFDGAAAGDGFGYAGTTAGDVNGDSISDLIIGAPSADVNGQEDAGSAYVVFGSSSSSATVDVATIDGTNGFRLDGTDENDRTGQAVAGNGDSNNDGFADVIVGSPWAEVDGVSVGAAYVYYGMADGFSATTDLGLLDGSDGFTLAGDYESDPLLYSFIVNTTGLTSHEVAGQNTDIVADAAVNFTSVIADDNSVYVHSSGIPFQVLGLWPGNPGTAADQDRTHVFPRNPVEETGDKTATTLGSTGVWIDGVAIYNWSDGSSYNNQGVWNQNAVYWEGPALDDNGGHVPPTGEYHTHAQNHGLEDDLDENSSEHSSLLGWAYDGFPVYGSFGYENADGTGDIISLQSSWQLRDITERTEYADGTDVADGPTIDEAALGAYIEDYEYVDGSGDLDEYNGRFSVTPEYPEGIYHYVVTIDENGEAAFPYVIGLEYYGVVEEANINTGGGGGGGPGDGGPPEGGGPGDGGPPVDGGDPGDGEPADGEPTDGEPVDDLVPEVTDISVAFAGDFNSDGYEDIVFGDPDNFDGADVSGTVYVIFGSESVDATQRLGDLTDETGVVFTGEGTGENIGQSVGSLDFNGDGVSDLIIGAPGAEEQAGQTFIVVGSPFLLGDANQDGVVNFLDISPFITLLSTETYLAEADTNQDGLVSFLDISPFISILAS